MHGPVDAATIVKGYEYGPGQHVVQEPENLDPLRPAQDKALRLERFLDLGHLDLLLLSGRSLHLLPDGVAAEHAYDVLREAMAQHRRLAVGRIVLGGHHQVVAVIAAGPALVAHVLHFPEHVRNCPRTANGRAKVASEEMRLASQLIEAASGGVDWATYRDESAQELRALVERKMQGHAGSDTASAPTVLPFFQALQQSVAAVETPVPEAPPQRKVSAPPPRKRRA